MHARSIVMANADMNSIRAINVPQDPPPPWPLPPETLPEEPPIDPKKPPKRDPEPWPEIDPPGKEPPLPASATA